MATIGTEKWFLSLGDAVLGPLSWTEVDERVRTAKAEDSACVRADGAQAWKPYRAVKVDAPAPGGAAAAELPPVDEESLRFCETAVRIGVLTPDTANQVLERRRLERASGQTKSIYAFLEEHGLLTVDHITAVLTAQKNEPAGPIVRAPGQIVITTPAVATTVSAPSTVGPWQTVKAKPLNFGMLFPFREWRQDSPWANPWVRWFAFYAIYPIALGEIVGNVGTLGDVVWALGAYFAVLSAFILYLWLEPGNVPWGRVVMVAGCTAVFGGVLVIFGQQNIPVVRELYAVQNLPDLGTRILGCILGTGIMEETVKALPIFWLFLFKKNVASLRQIAFLGAVSGLAFGVLEAVQYSYRYAEAHAEALLGSFVRSGGQQVDLSTYGQFVVAEGTRLVSLPLLHGLFTAITAVFVAFAASVATKKASLVITGLLLTATLHGLYDAALYDQSRSPWLAIAVALVTLLLFVLYSHTGEKILQSVMAEQAATGGAGGAPAAS
jgi:RsiW-degrading membrane proteinase PrsW (M82 family)